MGQTYDDIRIIGLKRFLTFSIIYSIDIAGHFENSKTFRFCFIAVQPVLCNFFKKYCQHAVSKSKINSIHLVIYALNCLAFEKLKKNNFLNNFFLYDNGLNFHLRLKNLTLF